LIDLEASRIYTGQLAFHGFEEELGGGFRRAQRGPRRVAQQGEMLPDHGQAECVEGPYLGSAPIMRNVY